MNKSGTEVDFSHVGPDGRDRMVDVMTNLLPVLAICGYSGAGKTTLILKLLHYLCQEKGLSVAVLKNDVHGLNVDCPGKDTDRFFQAGADVFARGPKQSFQRSQPQDTQDLFYRLRQAAEQHDCVLLEGHKGIPLPKVWLLNDGEDAPPEGVEQVLAVLPRDVDRMQKVQPLLEARLMETHSQAPVYGCVLVGGQSKRMGRPKHLLTKGGQTWLARTIGQLDEVCHDIVICGRAEIPQELDRHVRLSDPPDIKGPLAGILACMRWLPNARWLVAACDLPNLSVTALRWLLEQRRPGTWAIMPRLEDSPGLEPLLAYYDGRCRRFFEALVAQGNYCPLPLAEHDRVITPVVPEKLANAWDNVNTAADLQKTQSETSDH